MVKTHTTKQIKTENMTAEQNVFTSEQPQQEVSTVNTTVETSMPSEETTEQSNKETVENLEINTIATNVADIFSLVKVSNRKDEIIDHLHKELQQYKSGLQEAIIAPLLKTIVREYDRVSKQYCFYIAKAQEEPQSELLGKILYEFEMLSFSLLNLLGDYDIEPFNFKEGDAHDVKLQKIVKIVETEDPQRDGIVAECISCGFRNIATTRLFRQAEIKIYKFKKH